MCSSDLSSTPAGSSARLNLGPLSTDPVQQAVWAKNSRKAFATAKYSVNLGGKVGQKYFNAIWFYIVSMYWTDKVGIFGPDQDQDPAKLSDQDIAKYLADAPADDKKFLSKARSHIYIINADVHEMVENEVYAATIDAISDNIACKTYVENKLKAFSDHDKYKGVRSFTFTLQWIKRNQQANRKYLKDQIFEIGQAIAAETVLSQESFLTYLARIESAIWALQ